MRTARVRIASKAAYAESSGAQPWLIANQRYLRIVNRISFLASGSVRQDQ